MPEAIVRLGRGDAVVTMPEGVWWGELQQHLPAARARFDALPPLHRKIRRAAVVELARTTHPVPPQAIAARVGAPIDAVRTALAELERRLFFLVRDAAGDVSWAFPFTTDATPHRLELSSGERLYGAWAEDAFATPFVQGRLVGKPVTVRIASSCAGCGAPIRIDVDQELRWSAPAMDSTPLILEPSVDWTTFVGPSILHAYWRHSELFCTEEHARVHRRLGTSPDGLYLTLDQSARSSSLVQAALFGL